MLNLKKSSAGVISTDSSCDLNIWFRDISALSDTENSKNILFTYFSPDINDNLSAFTGPFIAFLLVPRPSAPPLCNFKLALFKSPLFSVMIIIKKRKTTQKKGN